MIRRLAAAGLVGLLVVAAAAFAVARASEAPVIRLSEFRVAAPSLLRPGSTEVSIRNSGRLEHDLVVVRTRRAVTDIPVGLNGVAPELAGRIVFGVSHFGHEHDRGGAVPHHYAAGTSRRAQLTLAPGRYVLLCSIPGHYERGQRTALTVR